MRIVLVSGGNTLAADAALAVAREQHGAAVDVITWAPPTLAVREECDHVVVLGPLTEPPDPVELVPAPAPEPRSNLFAARVAAAVAWRRRRLRRFARAKAGRARSLLGRDRALTWRRVRRSPLAMELLGRADLIVAVDSQAIRAAWEMARRRPGVAAVWGVAAARVAASRLALAISAVDVTEADEAVDSA